MQNYTGLSGWATSADPEPPSRGKKSLSCCFLFWLLSGSRFCEVPLPAPTWDQNRSLWHARQVLYHELLPQSSVSPIHIQLERASASLAFLCILTVIPVSPGARLKLQYMFSAQPSSRAPALLQGSSPPPGLLYTWFWLNSGSTLPNPLVTRSGSRAKRHNELTHGERASSHHIILWLSVLHTNGSP